MEFKNIVVVLPTFKRKVILPIVVDCLLKQTVKIKKIVICGSCPEDDAIANLSHRIHYERVNNDPLSNKINHSLQIAKTYFPDLVMMTSSNTLLSPNYIESMASHLNPKSNRLIIGANTIHVLKIDYRKDPISLQRINRNPTDYPVNPGRVMLPEVLDRMNWEMFPPDLLSGLNSNGNKKLTRVIGREALITYPYDDIQILEVKGPWFNLNTFEASLGKATVLKDAQGWMYSFFPDRLEEIWCGLEDHKYVKEVLREEKMGEEGFKHGSNFKCGPYVVIEDGCVFGDNVTIGPFCHFKANTIVGNNVKIDSYVKSSGSNKIEDNVTLRYNCTIAREVTVERGCYISPNVMTNYQTADGGHKGGTVIGTGSFIGTGTVIHHGVKIAPGTKIGAMSFVNKDITEAGTYIGVPAKRIK